MNTTLSWLTNEIERMPSYGAAVKRLDWMNRRAARRDHRDFREKIVAATIKALPENSDPLLGDYPEEIVAKVKQEYGFIWSLLLSAAIQIIVKLVIEWWLSRDLNVDVANRLRRELRGAA